MVADGFLERRVAEVRLALRARAQVAKKRLAQHFLLDPALLRRIVAAGGSVRDRDVVEIGPGPGGLTAALLEAGADVTAIEVDPEWARATALALVGRGALDLRIADALKTAVRTVGELARRSGRPPLVVSNLPYSIASRLIVDLVQARTPPERLVVMVQAEVAARITAPPGSAQRGLLTLLVQLHATAKRRFRVPRGAFTPPPKVESAVVEIVPDAERSARARERTILPALLKAAFQARRKTLRRGIAEAAGDDAIARVPPHLLSRRPEQMTEEQWLALADVLAGPPAACNAI